MTKESQKVGTHFFNHDEVIEKVHFASIQFKNSLEKKLVSVTPETLGPINLAFINNLPHYSEVEDKRADQSGNISHGPTLPPS